MRWGWRTDGAENFTKIDLKVSDGVPSSTFLKAAGLRNAGKSTTGAANVGLPVPDVQVTTGPVTLGQPIPLVDIALPVGTRLEILQAAVGPVLNGKAKVVDGPHTGIVGEVSAAQFANIADERA